MKNQVSSKTKWLLAALTLIGIIAVFVQYGLVPSMERYSIASKTNANAKLRLRAMEGLASDIENTDKRALDAEAAGKEYQSDYKSFESTEDIEGEFTRHILDKNLSPAFVKIQPEEVANVKDPFVKYSISIQADGGLPGIYALCAYINGEITYRLSDLKLVGGDEGIYKATFNITAVYINKESPVTDDEE